MSRAVIPVGFKGTAVRSVPAGHNEDYSRSHRQSKPRHRILVVRRDKVNLRGTFVAAALSSPPYLFPPTVVAVVVASASAPPRRGPPPVRSARLIRARYVGLAIAPTDFSCDRLSTLYHYVQTRNPAGRNCQSSRGVRRPALKVNSLLSCFSSLLFLSLSRSHFPPPLLLVSITARGGLRRYRASERYIRYVVNSSG